MNISHLHAVMPSFALSPLLAVLWERPWMLLWGAAAVLPLLIHLLSRRRYQTTPWAAMDFLLAAARKQSRRIRLENWLLLVLRMLIILLFVVALAAPYRESSQTIAPPDQRVHTIFVLDGSFSMGQTAGNKTAFDAAKDMIVRQTDRDDRRGDAFSLVLMAAPARAIVKSPSTDRRAFADAVGALELPHGRADLPGALALVGEMLDEAPQAWPPVVRQEVVFLTDLGRNTWGRAEGPLGGGDDFLSMRLAALAEKADLRLVELGSRAAANVAIARLALGENLALPGVETPISATVRNLSDATRGNVSVELLVDGRRVAQQAIRELPARGEATAAFAYRFAAAGQQTLEARIEPTGDALDIDNRRWLVVDVRDRLRTLCVAGKSGAADFVQVAASSKSVSAARFEANIVSPALLRSGLALRDYDAVVMCNVPPLGADELRGVGDFVREGGGLIWFLGDMTEVDGYNAMNAGEHAGLLPAAVVQPSAWGAYTIDPLDFAHAILDPFRGQQDATLARTPIERYVRLATANDRARQVFMRIAPTGDALAVEGRFGAGRVIQFATDGSLSSVDPASGQPWTYWPLWQSFLPVVQESLRYVVAGRDEQQNVTVGMPLGGVVAATSPDARIRVRRPGEIEDRVATVVADGLGRGRWTFDDTSQSGVFLVATDRDDGTRGDGDQRFAVNVDPAESDLARAARDELPEPLSVVDVLEPLAAASTEVAARDNWHVPLLCGLLALVIAESACAWFLGRRMA